MKSNLSFITLIATLAGRCCFARTNPPACQPGPDSEPVGGWCEGIHQRHTVHPGAPEPE